jgi:hypothetical protein
MQTIQQSNYTKSNIQIGNPPNQGGGGGNFHTIGHSNYTSASNKKSQQMQNQARLNRDVTLRSGTTGGTSTDGKG